MGQTPDEIRDDIEQTRTRMTETVEAIGYRADVKTRAKEAIVEKAEAVVGTKDTVFRKAQGAAARLTAPLPSPGDAASAVGAAGSSVADRVGEALPDRQQAREVISVAQSNPVGLALGATAVGFLIGLALPTTRTEDEKLGPMSDRLKEQAGEKGREALEHGKTVAMETLQTAGETIQEQGQEHAGQMADSLREGVRSVTSDD